MFWLMWLIFAASLSNGCAKHHESNCPFGYELQNYTIITSQCKGPKYLPELCCKAFKEFACPFARYLNNMTNQCSDTMFDYINLHGGYPPKLFASECREARTGLQCSEQEKASSHSTNATRLITHNISLWLIHAAFSLLLLLWLR